MNRLAEMRMREWNARREKQERELRKRNPGAYALRSMSYRLKHFGISTADLLVSFRLLNHHFARASCLFKHGIQWRDQYVSEPDYKEVICD